MALFDAPSHNISGDEDDATVPQKATTPLSDPDLVGRVLDYGDDAALSKAATVAKPFARAAAYAQKHRLLGVVPPGLREDAARALLPQRCAAARRRARAGRFARIDLGGDRPSPRFGHSAVAYGGGLWVFGGRDGARYHSDVWRFDVTTTAWRLVDVAGPAPRRAHTATLLADAMVVVGGGDSRGALGDVWRLALNNEVKWTKISESFASTHSDRPWRAWGHSAVGLEGREDLIVLFGGASNSGQVFRATNDVELLQITDEKGVRALVHAAEGQPPPAVYRHSCTPLGGDRFLVAGGYTFAPSISSEELDGGRGIALTYCTARAYELRIVRGTVRWAELSFAGPAPFPPRGGHAACRVSHDTVFVCGGGVMTAWLPEDVDRPREEDVDSCYVLTRTGETAWRCEAACCRMPHACGGHTACVGVVGDDVGVVVFGGRAYDNTADAHAGRDDMSVFSFLDAEDVALARGDLCNLSL